MPSRWSAASAMPPVTSRAWTALLADLRRRGRDPTPENGAGHQLCWLGPGEEAPGGGFVQALRKPQGPAVLAALFNGVRSGASLGSQEPQALRTGRPGMLESGSMALERRTNHFVEPRWVWYLHVFE